MQKPHYQIRFDRFNEHIADVQLTFTAHIDNPVVWLPTWIAGSYLIREFARNITALTAKIDDKLQRCQKLDKNHWQIIAKQGDLITVEYEVYAYDLSVRSAYIDQTRIYGNFTSLAVAVAGQEDLPIVVELICPNQFLQNPYHQGAEVSLITALPEKMHQQRTQTIYQLQADNYTHLTDSPFEIAVQDGFDFDVFSKQQNIAIPHRFFVSGQQQTNLERLHDDLSRICQSYIDWLEDTPFDDYLFMTMATGNDYGGLEHLASTSLITPRDDLPRFDEKDEPSDNYQTFLGLCSHEYFHAWWVKTVCPDVMLNPDINQLFSNETPSPLLWIFEGFTSYVDDFMLQKSGVICQNSYLKLLTNQINRYLQTVGRFHQSVAESSFDAWLKLYRADENTANAGISYYNKGALVALCLDLTLKQQGNGKRLFDVIKKCYDLAKNNENQKLALSDKLFDEIVCEFLPHNIWQDFRQNYVNGTTELPLFELLSNEGLIIEQKAETVAWGLKISTEPLGLKIKQVLRDSQASHAGFSAHDVIVAIDGLKASEKLLSQTAYQQKLTEQPIICHVFRKDELLPIVVNPEKSLEKVVLSWRLTATQPLAFLNF